MIVCVDTIPTNHVPNLSISYHHGKIWSIKISFKMYRTSPIWTSSERLMYNQFTSCVYWAEVLMYIQIIYTLCSQGYIMIKHCTDVLQSLIVTEYRKFVGEVDLLE